MSNHLPNTKISQLSTFFISDRWYGIDVIRVQEIVKPMDITTIPLAPNYVRGLINLRGQIATAIGLRELLGLQEESACELFNVVCKLEGYLLSLQVDRIGDVIEVCEEQFEQTPTTVPMHTRQFLSGIYKFNDRLLSVIDIDRIMEYLTKNAGDLAA